MKFYRTLNLSLLLAAVCLQTEVYSQQLEDKRLKLLTRMQQLQQEYGMPSLSLAIGLGDKVVFAEAVGMANVEQSKRATKETKYSVGSIAKPMTGLGLARLVDQGKLNLKDTVDLYVPEPGYTKHFNLEQLAAHLAGIPHETPGRKQREFVNMWDHHSPFESLSVFAQQPLLFEPGTGFKYSSNGYILLSAVLEQAAKQNFVNYLEQELWQEFALTHTQLDDSKVTGEAHYYRRSDTKEKFILATEKQERSFLFGAGGFVSTPSDLVKLSQALYSNGYLSDDIKQKMQTPARLDSGEVNPQKYSLGWRVAKMRKNQHTDKTWTALHHGGVTSDIATAYLLVVPECKAAIAFAINSLPDKFWQLRPKMADVLRDFIPVASC